MQPMPCGLSCENIARREGSKVELVSNEIYRVRAPLQSKDPNDPVETVWFAAYYLGETTTGYLFSPIVSDYADVVVREEWIKELGPEIRDRIKFLKKRILDLNAEIDTLYEELANLFAQ
jgi:hypothetical protein